MLMLNSVVIALTVTLCDVSLFSNLVSDRREGLCKPKAPGLGLSVQRPPSSSSRCLTALDKVLSRSMRCFSIASSSFNDILMRPCGRSAIRMGGF